MLRNKKYGFTLAEVVVACSIFAIVVVGIILAINRSFSFMNNIRLSVRAANFAREGVEMMYNIRDTNWRKYSGRRDKLWLYNGEGNDIFISSNGTFQTSSLFVPGIYVLKKKEETDGNFFFYAQKLDISDQNEEDFYSNDGFWNDEIQKYSEARDEAELDFGNEEYSYYKYELVVDDDETEKYEWIKNSGNVQDTLIGDGLEFYRIVRVFGVYCKNSDSSDQLVDNSNCANDSDPKEMRFCVKVFYRGNGEHSSELCSIMTNFME